MREKMLNFDCLTMGSPVAEEEGLFSQLDNSEP
jgi:hypothetical protein